MTETASPSAPPAPPAPSAPSGRMQLLLHAPIPQMLWRLATPNVLAAAMMTAVTVADAFWVGQLGTAPLASLALVFPLQTLMQMMAGGAIGGGVTSALARALGSGDSVRAQAVAWAAFLIGLAMTALYMLVLGVFARPVFAALGGEGAVLQGAVAYAQVAFGGAASLWLMFVFSAILRGTGDTVTPARAAMIASLLQVPLSGGLTLGWGPLPALGIAGPAAALVLCQGAAALYLGRHLIGGRAAVRLAPRGLELAAARAIMAVGGVGLINSLTIAFTVVLVTGFVAQYGAAALAGYGLGSRLELMLVPLAFGIGAALTAAVGANFGAGQYERARRIAWTGAGVTLVVAGAVGIAVAVAPWLWLDRFTADDEVYAFGARYLAIAAPLYGLFAAGQTLYFASQGTGRMLLPVAVGVVRLAIVGIAGAMAVAFAWPVEVVFAAVAVGLATIGLGLAACLFAPGWNPQTGPGRARP